MMKYTILIITATMLIPHYLYSAEGKPASVIPPLASARDARVAPLPAPLSDAVAPQPSPRAAMQAPLLPAAAVASPSATPISAPIPVASPNLDQAPRTTSCLVKYTIYACWALGTAIAGYHVWEAFFRSPSPTYHKIMALTGIVTTITPAAAHLAQARI
jgi:hypothetical protein